MAAAVKVGASALRHKRSFQAPLCIEVGCDADATALPFPVTKPPALLLMQCIRLPPFPIYTASCTVAVAGVVATLSSAGGGGGGGGGRHNTASIAHTLHAPMPLRQPSSSRDACTPWEVTRVWPLASSW